MTPSTVVVFFLIQRCQKDNYGIKRLDFSCFAEFFLFFILFSGELSRVLIGCVQYPDDTWPCTIVTIVTSDHNDNSAKILLVEASIGRAFRWSEENLEKHKIV